METGSAGNYQDPVVEHAQGVLRHVIKNKDKKTYKTTPFSMERYAEKDQGTTITCSYCEKQLAIKAFSQNSKDRRKITLSWIVIGGILGTIFIMPYIANFVYEYDRVILGFLEDFFNTSFPDWVWTIVPWIIPVTFYIGAAVIPVIAYVEAITKKFVLAKNDETHDVVNKGQEESSNYFRY